MITVQRGADLTLRCRLREGGGGAPLDLAGQTIEATLVGQGRAEPLEVTVTDAAAGAFTVRAAAATLADCPARTPFEVRLIRRQGLARFGAGIVEVAVT